MKLKFKRQAYQTEAVEAVVECFAGQPKSSGLTYRMDPGAEQDINLEYTGFRNAEIAIPEDRLLENIQKVQRERNLPQSSELVKSRVSPVNLDVEMETGTGKTYCYIKTIHEMYERYGWSKFIIVVPSVAIREGVAKSFDITSEHFQETYGKKIKYFIYNSKQLHNLESFSSDAGINVMIINVQAFNARGKDARRIYEELDDFQSRRPIDVIKANHPILIIDEPQKIEGDSKKASKSFESLKEFNPLMILRYSATHRKQHNKIHRLDALDAYNQKLVKKIAVRGITVSGLSGTSAYLYLESIEVSKQAPVARLELEVKQKSGTIKRVTRKLSRGDNLFELSNELEQYKGFVISEINAVDDTVGFTNGKILNAGEATGDVNESTLRRIQIREAIKAHFEKERILFRQGIKVLTLFFIDEVAKYRLYAEDGSEEGGEYAKMFEEEYGECLSELRSELFLDEEYGRYLDGIAADKTHNGYFSIDKKSKRLVDPVMRKTAAEAEDADAYDLILKDKERLLSFEEPTRFIFSHSALREGWDNPNVFVICTLKHSDNTISKRQEVGRGMRLAVNQQGERQDDPETVHRVNVLTVVANESYKDFVADLQKDICESLSGRPRVADTAYFTGKVFEAGDEKVEVTPHMAKQIYRYLVKNDYTDDDDNISPEYHQAKKEGALAELPEELRPYKEQIFKLIDSVFSDAQLPDIANERAAKTNKLNANFEKKEFKELWKRINRKAVYSVHFDSGELIGKCVAALNKELRVSPLKYTVLSGEQREQVTYNQLESGNGFEIRDSSVAGFAKSIRSSVQYDLIGKIAGEVKLTRKSVARILVKLEKSVFAQFKTNPENFIAEAVRVINEQKAAAIVEHLTYDALSETHSTDIFTAAQAKQDFSKAGGPLKRHIYDYVVTDSKTERRFAEELDASAEVVVYAKLPSGFTIPTPVGNYNPDWAIAFKEGAVKHIYFVAETKGSMSSMELRKIEETKIECARKFFDALNKKVTKDNVRYDVVDSYGKLMDMVS